MTKDFEEAEISYSDRPTLNLNRADDLLLTIAAIGAVPSAVSGEFGAQGMLTVTCNIEARLIADEQEVRVNPTGFQAQRYVPPAAAEWSWQVTPLRAGEIEAKYEIRPVVVMERQGGMEKVTYVTKAYPFTIDVKPSLLDRVKELTETVNVLAAAVTAIGLLLVGLGIKRWGPKAAGRLRRRIAPESDGASTEDESTGYL